MPITQARVLAIISEVEALERHLAVLQADIRAARSQPDPRAGWQMLDAALAINPAPPLVNVRIEQYHLRRTLKANIAKKEKMRQRRRSANAAPQPTAPETLARPVSEPSAESEYLRWLRQEAQAEQAAPPVPGENLFNPRSEQ